MFSKRESGFVFAVLALLVFSGFFVSAYSFSDFFSNLFGNPSITGNVVLDVNTINYTYTTGYSPSNWIGTTQYKFTLPHQMSAHKIDLTVGSFNAQNCNISVNISSVSAPGENSYYFLVNKTVYIISIPYSADVNFVKISSAGSCNINDILEIYNLSIVGTYPFLSDSVKSFSPGLVSNAQTNLTIDPSLDISQINLSLRLSSTPSCIVNVSTLTGNVLKVVDSFNLNAIGLANRDLSRSIYISSPTKNSKIVISSTKSIAGVYCYNSIINFTNIIVAGKDINQTIPVCASFDYSNWSECVNNTQERSILVSYPSGCIGGSPENLSQECNLSSNVTCTDSDGGLNYSVKGDTFGISIDGSTWNKTDYCDGSLVHEYDCNGSLSGNGGSFVCPNGCVDGACVNNASSNVTCTDSDGGLNYGVRGYTYGSEWANISNVVNSSDFCITSGEKAGRLAEYICQYNQVGSESFACPNGCVNGSCVNYTEASCVDTGRIDNGITCVENITCPNGCILENNRGVSVCVKPGFKLIAKGSTKYCDLQNLTFKTVLANNQVCNSHSECNSNFCFKNATASYCMDLTVVGGIQDTIIKFVCWFTTIGQGEANYNTCKANKAAAYLK